MNKNIPKNSRIQFQHSSRLIPRRQWGGSITPASSTFVALPQILNLDAEIARQEAERQAYIAGKQGTIQNDERADYQKKQQEALTAFDKATPNGVAIPFLAQTANTSPVVQGSAHDKKQAVKEAVGNLSAIGQGAIFGGGPYSKLLNLGSTGLTGYYMADQWEYIKPILEKLKRKQEISSEENSNLLMYASMFAPWVKMQKGGPSKAAARLSPEEIAWWLEKEKLSDLEFARTGQRTLLDFSDYPAGKDPLAVDWTNPDQQVHSSKVFFDTPAIDAHKGSGVGDQVHGDGMYFNQPDNWRNIEGYTRMMQQANELNALTNVNSDVEDMIHYAMANGDYADLINQKILDPRGLVPGRRWQVLTESYTASPEIAELIRDGLKDTYADNPSWRPELYVQSRPRNPTKYGNIGNLEWLSTNDLNKWGLGLPPDKWISPEALNKAFKDAEAKYEYPRSIEVSDLEDAIAPYINFTEDLLREGQDYSREILYDPSTTTPLQEIINRHEQYTGGGWEPAGNIYNYITYPESSKPEPAHIMGFETPSAELNSYGQLEQPVMRSFIKNYLLEYLPPNLRNQIPSGTSQPKGYDNLIKQLQDWERIGLIPEDFHRRMQDQLGLIGSQHPSGMGTRGNVSPNAPKVTSVNDTISKFFWNQRVTYKISRNR